jgi:citrate synthase
MSWCKWLGQPESAETEELLDTLCWCNQAAATTNANASSAAVANAAVCGSRFEHSVASALLTFGKIHGPIMEARGLLYHTQSGEVVDWLEEGLNLPGWGNAFYKKSIDPAFVPMEHLIKEQYADHHDKITRIAELIFKVRGRVLYPNAATYGAVTAEILALARGTEMILPIAFRLPSWAKQHIGAKPCS